MPPKKKSPNAAEGKEPIKGKKSASMTGDTEDRDSGNEADNDDSDSEDSSPAEQPIKVNLYEPAALLHTLDEHTAKALSEDGFTEDFQYSNSKLLIGFLASAVALLGQFYPMPFPDSRWFLLVCVLTYFIASGVLQLIHYFFEANCIHISKAKPRKPAIVVRTKPFKFDTDYSLIFAYRENHYPAFAPNTFEKTLQINDYFDTTGVFLKSKFTADVRAAVNDFTTQHPAPASSASSAAGRRKQEWRYAGQQDTFDQLTPLSSATTSYAPGGEFHDLLLSSAPDIDISSCDPTMMMNSFFPDETTQFLSPRIRHSHHVLTMDDEDQPVEFLPNDMGLDSSRHTNRPPISIANFHSSLNSFSGGMRGGGSVSVHIADEPTSDNGIHLSVPGVEQVASMGQYVSSLMLSIHDRTLKFLPFLLESEVPSPIYSSLQRTSLTSADF